MLCLPPALSCNGFNQIIRSILYFISVKLDARLNLDLIRGRNKSIVTTAIIHSRQEVCKSILRRKLLKYAP